MLKKKNYKDTDHFNQYYSVSVPRPNGNKVVLYFKRYKPTLAPDSNINIYDVISGRVRSTPANVIPSEYPIDRTLEIISFDQELSFTKELTRKIGRIRKHITGETQFKNKTTFYAIVIFKFEFDLVKCFRDQFFQGKIDEMYKEMHVADDERQQYRQKIIEEHLAEELHSKVDKLKQLQEEGYNVITDKFGQYKMDYEANQKFVEELPQVKKSKKANSNQQKGKNRKKKVSFEKEESDEQ